MCDLHLPFKHLAMSQALFSWISSIPKIPGNIFQGPTFLFGPSYQWRLKIAGLSTMGEGIFRDKKVLGCMIEFYHEFII